ncbi:UNVERIFIED_CONTAM: hypothetical protein Scaly_0471800 [Sesamum calycinum]|uniref:SWIM-type domain-containing protein n=1 Tax=Sesamum calycinum TaxID=2727403 RepID=A0AAW2SGE9_9LAMI
MHLWMFQLNGYPCCHACAAIATKRVQIDEYVDVCYKKSTYLRVYAEMIHAVPGAKDYVQTGYEPLKPPKFKTKRGRPKKLRRRGPNEMQTTSTRKGLTHTCTKCLGKGHNKRNCTNEPHPKSKFYKGISHEEILVEGSQIPPASQEHELQSEATRGTKVEQTSVDHLQQHTPQALLHLLMYKHLLDYLQPTPHKYSSI